MNHSPIATVPTRALATVVLDGEALRAALVEALTDPRVVEAIAIAYGRDVAPIGGTSRFMDTKEYARHVRVSSARKMEGSGLDREHVL